jgi:ATP-dependent RNA helicase CshB
VVLLFHYQLTALMVIKMHEISLYPFEIDQLNLSLIDAVKDLNFEKPTEIQNRIIPRILKRTNLIGQSQTGTGKSFQN